MSTSHTHISHAGNFDFVATIKEPSVESERYTIEIKDIDRTVRMEISSKAMLTFGQAMDKWQKVLAKSGSPA